MILASCLSPRLDGLAGRARRAQAVRSDVLGKRSALAALMLAAAAVLVLALWHAPAFADETATQEDVDAGNAVNVQQRPDSSFIYDTSIADLATADSYYDGQTVQVTGEVVGDKIRASLLDDRRWITLESKDGDAYISVYTTEEQAGKIDSYGKYGVEGTMLQVRGTYHLVCPDHDGLSDLHAEAVSVVSPGMSEPDELDPMAFIPGAFLVMIGLGFTATYYLLRERQR